MRAILLFVFLPHCLAAAVWNVTPGNRTIHEAVELAQPLDTIMIQRGVYREGNIIVRKSLTFIGVDNPTLDGQDKEQILTILANNVTITGITFSNTGIASMDDLAGIAAVAVDQLWIHHNVFTSTFFGIHLSKCSHSKVEHNTLAGDVKTEHQSGNGIHLWKCHHMAIRNNEVSGHRDGIYFEFVTESEVISNNSHDNLRYGLHFMFSHDDVYRNNVFSSNGAGVAVMYTKGVTMTGNRFKDNVGPSSYGLLLKDIRDSEVIGNYFSNNTAAIYLEGCSRNKIRNNEFTQNGWAVRLQASCDRNELIANSFVGNSFDLVTNGSISLNTLDGNYWDQYQGYDLDRDGRGDVPYRPVSLYGMVVERVPSALILWRSMLVGILDRTEKAIPALIPENLFDGHPAMKKP